MYKEPHYKGEQIPYMQVYGILADSSLVQILPEDLGMNFWMFEDFMVEVDQEIQANVQVYVDANRK
jgi:hypothetical protein